MPIIHNKAKRKLAAGDIALGFGLHHLRSTAAPMLALAADHDYLSMDMEHGAFTIQEATQICIASLAAGLPAFVRVCAGAIDEGTRLLDNGALGIIVPHVDTAKQARRVADAFHYPPAGERSWGGPPPLYSYLPPHVAEAQKAINDEVLTIVMLETAEAIGNAGAIAAVPGIDVLLIGTNDLAMEMGIPGQFDHAEIERAYERVIAACRRHGKAPGMGGVYTEELLAKYVDLGMRMILSGNDLSLIVAAGNQKTKFLRARG